MDVDIRASVPDVTLTTLRPSQDEHVGRKDDQISRLGEDGLGRREDVLDMRARDVVFWRAMHEAQKSTRQARYWIVEMGHPVVLHAELAIDVVCEGLVADSWGGIGV